MTRCLRASFVARLLFVLGFITVLVLALYPNLRLPEFTPSGQHSDLAYHMIAFFLLTVSAINVERTVIIVPLMVVFAIALELLQAFVPGREVYLIDVVASLSGTVIAPLALQLWRRLFDIRWHHGL